MFESARLTDAHTLEGFDCGKESLNTWLLAHARRADSSGVAHVYVWTPPGEQKVSAYFAICPTEVVRNDDGVSGSMAGGYSRIPGYLIARLAIDTMFPPAARREPSRAAAYASRPRHRRPSPLPFAPTVLILVKGFTKSVTSCSEAEQ